MTGTHSRPSHMWNDGRVPEWTRHAHHELLAEHLDQVATLDRPGSKLASITERLDRLEQPTDPQQSSNIGLEL